MWGHPGCPPTLSCSWLRLPVPHQHQEHSQETAAGRPQQCGLRTVLYRKSLLELEQERVCGVHTQWQHKYTHKSIQQLVITFLRTGRMHVVDIEKVHVSHLW